MNHTKNSNQKNEIITSTGSIDRGGRCLLKVYVFEGKVRRVTAGLEHRMKAENDGGDKR